MEKDHSMLKRELLQVRLKNMASENQKLIMQVGEEEELLPASPYAPASFLQMQRKAKRPKMRYSISNSKDHFVTQEPKKEEVYTFRKVTFIVTVCGKHTRVQTFQNVCRKSTEGCRCSWTTMILLDTPWSTKSRTPVKKER